MSVTRKRNAKSQRRRQRNNRKDRKMIRIGWCPRKLVLKARASGQYDPMLQREVGKV